MFPKYLLDYGGGSVTSLFLQLVRKNVICGYRESIFEPFSVISSEPN